MKRILLITIGLILSLNAFSENLDKGCTKLKSNKLLCGNTITTYDSNYLYKHGEFKTLFKNKKIKITGSYEKGRKAGVWKHFYSNGAVQSLNFFYKGFRYDKRELYNRQGKLLKRMIYPSLEQIKKEQEWKKNLNDEKLETLLHEHLSKKTEGISNVSVLEKVNLKSKSEISIVVTKNKIKYFTHLYIKKLKAGWKIW